MRLSFFVRRPVRLKLHTLTPDDSLACALFVVSAVLFVLVIVLMK